MKRKPFLFSAIAITSLCLAFTGCGDDDDNNAVIPPAGPGGLAEISAYARLKHEGTLVSGATIYLKYGATEFPGTDTSLYDATHICGTTGHGLGHSHIDLLHQGAYYLYVTGYDSAASVTVTGNKGVELESETDHEEINISLE